MTDTQTPEDWVLIEAAKRCGWSDLYTLDTLHYRYANDLVYRSLSNMIAKHEQKPVDRKLLCAREAWEQWQQQEYAEDEWFGIRAIELWEEGFGK